jgi:hypothetical protein
MSALRGRYALPRTAARRGNPFSQSDIGAALPMRKLMADLEGCLIARGSRVAEIAPMCCARFRAARNNFPPFSPAESSV